jgi:hypothetical protein
LGNLWRFIFKNENGKLAEVTDTGITGYTGWWNSIIGADFDKDGDTDYVAGNLGLNNIYNIAYDRPLGFMVRILITMVQ